LRHKKQSRFCELRAALIDRLKPSQKPPKITSADTIARGLCEPLAFQHLKPLLGLAGLR
jgi:hypothetical protein